MTEIFKKTYKNIHLTLFLRLLILIIIYSFSRFLFLFCNLQYFNAISFIEVLKIFYGGLRFDISAILMVNSLFIILYVIPLKISSSKWYRKIILIFFYITNSIILLLNFIDIIYYRFTFKRTTSDIFNYMSVGGDFDKLLPQFIKDFWFIPLLWIASIYLFIYLNTKIKDIIIFDSKLKSIIKRIVIFFFIIGATIIGIRGGLQLRPLDIINAGKYTSAKNISLVLNTPFSVIKTVGLPVLEYRNYFEDEQLLESIYSPFHIFDNSEVKMNKLNVVVIILESISQEHIGALNKIAGYEGFTPFLDTLIRDCYVAKAYANGKRSIEGIPAITAGIPTLMNEAFIMSRYAGNSFNSLASILKSEGYNTSFFHGGTNGTMGFDSFSKVSGYDTYYGRSQYNNEADYDGKWGIYDEPFLLYFASKLNEKKQPFFSTLFTLSSHHPYSVPEKYKGKFKKGKLEIQESVMYADYSLKKFFETASKQDWYNNTLFVITADHSSESFFEYYQNTAGMYAIPILYYMPGNKQIKEYPQKLSQQIDIMPSVLGLLNYKKDYFCFGNNIFDTLSPNFQISYLNGEYQLIKDHYLLRFDGSSSNSLYNIDKDSLMKNNLISKELKEKETLELYIKSFIQQYNNRLINNKMQIGK